MRKTTHCLQNYTLCVKLHTLWNMCKTTHCVQNYTGVPIAFNMKNSSHLKILEYYEVCGSVLGCLGISNKCTQECGHKNNLDKNQDDEDCDDNDK